MTEQFLEKRPNVRIHRSVWILATFYIVAGILHFVTPKFYLAIMPEWIPEPLLMVYLSGIAEIAVGIGALIPQLRRAAGVGLILLLIAIFPANIHMAIQAFERGAPVWVLIGLTAIRLPLQGVLIWWGWRVLLKRDEHR